MNLPLLSRTGFLGTLMATALLLVAFACGKDDDVDQPSKPEKIKVPPEPEMVLVKGGAYIMGRGVTYDSGLYFEFYKPPHPVAVSDFYLGKYEVTTGQYLAFCEDTDRKLPNILMEEKHYQLPVTDVSHEDAVAYCQWLSEKFGGQWRLPTEAEWEYAARGGNQSKGYNYAGGNDYMVVGWYYSNTPEKRPVGTKLPNELGIYDMSGNVNEWCADWYDEGYYAVSPSINPQGPQSGTRRVVRGGDFRGDHISGYVSVRNNEILWLGSFYGGFRVARTP